MIESLRGLNAIAVNATALTAPWAPVWFFSDWRLLLDRDSGGFRSRSWNGGVDMVDFAESFAGLVVTTARQVKDVLGDRVHLIRCEKGNGFPTPPGVRQGRSSGQTAIGLAIALGATRIDLYGFDMRVVDGREHHHGEYEGRHRDTGIYARAFLPAFAGWNEQAVRAGVTVVNATPGSALREFPMREGLT